MVNAYIGVGSNLNEPKQQVAAAVLALNEIPRSSVTRTSSLYCSKPLGVQNQPDFINAVVAFNTLLDPHELLGHLQDIECAQGRVRDGTPWGPRTIDLDVLLYGNEMLATATLVVPHPGLVEREFVIYPLAEIAPDLVLPDGVAISALQAACPARAMVRVPQDEQ